MRIYNPEAEEGERIKLTKEQQRHAKVLRLKAGEKIKIFDGKGKEFEGTYEEKVRGTILVGKEVASRKEPENAVSLAIAPVKGNRMDFLIEKVSELGANRIIPIETERSIVKPRESKIERWKKIAIEGCRQSGRATVPEIEEMQSFDEAVGKVSEHDRAYICDPEGEEMEPAGKVIIFVGPEGGFTDDELKKAEEAGIKKMKLSNSILRTETAGIVSVAFAAKKE